MSAIVFLLTLMYLSFNLNTVQSHSKLSNISVPGKIIEVQTSFGGVSVRVIGNPSDTPIICLPGINPKLVNEWAIVGEPISQKGFVVYLINFHSNPNTTPSLLMGGISNVDVLKVINEVMVHIQAQQIILMGKSWGGGQAMNFAKEYPNKISKLCLIAPASSNPSTIKQLGQNSFPIYLGWAEDDSTIWYSNTNTWKQILEPSQLTFHSIRIGGHRILIDYAQSLINFLEKK